MNEGRDPERAESSELSSYAYDYERMQLKKSIQDLLSNKQKMDGSQLQKITEQQ